MGFGNSQRSLCLLAVQKARVDMLPWLRITVLFVVLGGRGVSTGLAQCLSTGDVDSTC